jgi:hypothetical protein
LLGLGFVFACDNGSATMGVIMFEQHTKPQPNPLPTHQPPTIQYLRVGRQCPNPQLRTSFFARVAVAFLLGLGFVFACDNGSANIGVIMFVKTSELNIWVGDAHHLPDANKLLLTLAENIDIERPRIFPIFSANKNTLKFFIY